MRQRTDKQKLYGDLTSQFSNIVASISFYIFFPQSVLSGKKISTFDLKLWSYCLGLYTAKLGLSSPTASSILCLSRHGFLNGTYVCTSNPAPHSKCLKIKGRIVKDASMSVDMCDACILLKMKNLLSGLEFYFLCEHLKKNQIDR